MLAHGLAIDPSRTLRCPATSKVSTAPLGLVTSLSFNRRCKEKNKVFINVDRYTKYSTPFCYAQRNARIIPLATASFGDMADSTREYLLTMSMTRRSYIISSYTEMVMGGPRARRPWAPAQAPAWWLQEVCWICERPATQNGCPVDSESDGYLRFCSGLI